MKIMILILFTLMACDEKNVDQPSRYHHVHLSHNHAGEHAKKIDVVLQSRVEEWETFLASGQLLNGVTPTHLRLVEQAVLDGVFDPDTTLTAAAIKRIGPANCTHAPSDTTIGVRRFERTLTMAPELLSLRDTRGKDLRQWLLGLKRNDLFNLANDTGPLSFLTK